MVMVSALLTKAEVERQRQRGSNRIVRRAANPTGRQACASQGGSKRRWVCPRLRPKGRLPGEGAYSG